MHRISLKTNIAALAAALVVSVILLMTLPVKARIDSSNATFNEAIQAVKSKDFRHAAKLFLIQAENDQHDAQYNLALLLEAGKGTPQNFAKALTWAWSAQLGGIEAAEELAEVGWLAGSRRRVKARHVPVFGEPTIYAIAEKGE